ncbi:phospholipase D-like domain-containing protein [Catalinimonas niigatensis]|uniref:phospholipase D-like domain-containing protein n=1 Tax=Catalinimonas niigatensis TaxID=1397264 RepID=UPI002666C16F|nr:phospholipase D-like domain-containing protein [Catalinimonas niigatensis]WPP49967.1 phospholipase D-like domain-containing protein [Catalinimonas niigatensis]
MFGSNGTIDQQIIYTREEIYARLEKEFTAAQTEILIAVDRFTHQELLKLLFKKIEEGVKIEMIISEPIHGDSHEKEARDDKSSALEQLILQGATVLQVEQAAHDMVQQKFCVLDRKVALYGAYDWSIHEQGVQQESIVLTHHKSTVDRLVAHFYDIKGKAFQLKATPQKKSLLDHIRAVFGIKGSRPKHASQDNAEKQLPSATEDKRSEYERVLDSMIAAEVSNFDRELLRKQGYERAKANNGDAQVLSKGLDSVYSVFVNEINVIEDKKARLITKIEEQRVKSTGQLKEQLDLQMNTLDAQFDARRESLQHKITSLESQVAVHEKEIESIRNSKIPAVQEKNSQIEQQIKAQERDFVKPAFKWFEFIPVTLMNLGLLFYLFFFYSSAAYILLFSELDAKEARLRGITVNPPEVFNPEAIGMAADKGGSALFFIILFVFVPLSLALLGRFVKDLKWWGTTLMVLGIILVDAFIAYKVAEAIHNVEYLTGNVDVLWEFPMAFEDLNFYLVFILGALGLLLFKITFEKFMRFFEERNPDMNHRKNQQHIKHLRADIADNNARKLSYGEEIGRIEKEIIQRNSDIHICREELAVLPVKKTHQIESKKTEMTNKAQSMERITDIYKTHIENDILPISIDSIKDRINVFLEGWNDFLHDEYSVSKAIEKSKAAAEVATLWQTDKLSGNRFDQRIKA